MIEMELFHNYSNYTSNTFDRNPAIQVVWRVNVPQVAFANSFVMDSILCVSALHMASSRPDMRDKYVSLGLQHHERGLAQVNSILGTNVTEQNCTALYIFSALTGMISFAKPKKPDDFLLLGQDGIASWLMLFRGTRHVIDSYHNTILHGTLGSMLTYGYRRREIWLSGGDYKHEPLEKLMHYIGETVRDEKILAIYQAATKQLRQTFFLLSSSPLHASDCADVFMWFFEVSEEYLALLYTRSQEALAVFAFYCVVLGELEWSWFLDGWSKHIISIVHRNLDIDHRIWIQWPLEQIGWNPNC
jgi:hypothetical protein